jgi:RND family efflux transporter MFP subunit
MNTSRKKIIALVFGLLLVCGGVFAYQQLKKAKQTQPTNTKAATLSLQVATPEQLTWSNTLLAQGAIAAWQESSISTEIGGLRIARILVDVGSQVKRGQVLATLANDNLQVNIHKQQAAVALAKANLNKAKTDALRANTISSSGALSEQKIQEYQVAEETAKANLESAKASLESAQIDLAHTKILAPDNGVISARTATLGAVVNTGTELFKLIRQNRLEWRAEVAPAELRGLKVGQKAKLSLPQGGEITGTVRSIAPSLNADTRVAFIYIDLPNNSPAKAGMYAEGRIELGQSAALTVPESALVLRDGLNYVFEIDAKNTVQQRAVKVGRRDNKRVEIVDGLSTQARIAASGGAFLNQGDLVNIVQ